MGKTSIENLREQMKKREEKKEVNRNNLLILKSNQIEEFKYFDNLESTEDIKNMLKEKALQILSLNLNSQLELGKILSETFEELSRKKDNEGTYEKFLNFIGYNKRTALRYRKKYDLYKLAIGEKSKIAIAKLSFRDIDKIYESTEDIKNIIAELEIGKDIKNIPFLENKENYKNEIIEENILINLASRINKSLKKLDVSNIEKEKEEKIERLLQEIENLLK